MRRAAILTGEVIGIELLAAVCIAQPPSSQLSVHASGDCNQPWSEWAVSSDGNHRQAFPFALNRSNYPQQGNE